MKLKTKIEVEVDPNSNEHHHYMIQALQILCREHYEDLSVGTRMHLLEDIDDCERRLKAIKVLLKYHMIPSDYDEFIRSVKRGTDYTFNPERYEDL
jgi:hypothetical protein